MRLGSTGADGDVLGRATGTDVLRGGLLVVVALAIGGYVLANVSGSSSVATAVEPDPAGATTADDETGEEDTTATSEGGESMSGSEDTGATTMADGDDGTGTSMNESAPTTETTLAADLPADPSQITVLVLNGAQVQGIAAKGTDKAANAGYQTMVAKNATGTQTSAIYYADGFEDEALILSGLYGTDLQSIVAPLDLANPPGDEIDGADIIVVLGTDELINVD